MMTNRTNPRASRVARTGLVLLGLTVAAVATQPTPAAPGPSASTVATPASTLGRTRTTLPREWTWRKTRVSFDHMFRANAATD